MEIAILNHKRFSTFENISSKLKWLTNCVDIVNESEYIVILAGAGMGADCGLPTFRDKTGFWKAYPPAQKAGLSFQEYSNPAIFTRDNAAGWGFFGHRYHLYSKAAPHLGYDILKEWVRQKNDYFIFTSNVDGHFLKSGFDPKKIFECHGSIHYIQAQDSKLYGNSLIEATSTTLPDLEIDETTFLAKGTLPTININGKEVASRPNIMMFYDNNFVTTRSREQELKFNNFLVKLPKNSRIVLIEIGAGNGVPTVRMNSEKILRYFPQSNLIRINVEESEGPERTISVPMGAKDALRLVNEHLN